MHGIQLDSWPHLCNSYKLLEHIICSCTSVTSIYMYVGLWSLIIHACVLETKVTNLPYHQRMFYVMFIILFTVIFFNLSIMFIGLFMQVRE